MINKDGTVVVGVKGKSGRKSADYETTKRRVIGKAWAMIDEGMDKKEIEKVAVPLALKDMVAKIGNPDGSKIEPIQIYAGKAINSLPEYKGNTTDIQPEEEDTSS